MNKDNQGSGLEGIIRSAFADFSGDSVKHLTSQLISDIEEFFETKKECLSDMKGKYKNQIRDNPFSSVLGALAIGVVIGMCCKK